MYDPVLGGLTPSHTHTHNTTQHINICTIVYIIYKNICIYIYMYIYSHVLPNFNIISMSSVNKKTLTFSHKPCEIWKNKQTNEEMVNEQRWKLQRQVRAHERKLIPICRPWRGGKLLGFHTSYQLLSPLRERPAAEIIVFCFPEAQSALTSHWPT